MTSVKDILFNLLSLTGPSGGESEVQQMMGQMMTPFIDGMYVDNIGNRIFYKKGIGVNKKRIMLVAHADEVAMMVTYIDSNGYVYFQEAGAIDTNVLPEQMVEIHHAGSIAYGIIGKKPIHL